ncbi:Na/Pi cotransporter family protein [Seongchinamella unica]|uniref:Na/Pi cotransporter family protein n=1 Tax=Seongchinamella unica TaxID=2547392 RepID=A0A4R5LPG3_9GAMM|nr:Na/Pi cotransporter family protein [Seongchinamella unica]
MDYGFSDLLTLLGALGLFLYGMRVMSDALVELAGDRMRNVLATTTSNRFLAVLTGFSITAIIQSSSATTLMVVSFTNAGLLTLVEAIGVIMGANIGTTVTAWLISIVGFKLSMSALALPLVGLGFICTLREDRQWQQWGYFIIGFAVLFIGLQFLKESVPDVSGSPEALAALAAYTDMGFLSVLIFLALGALLTLVMQSSSAAMALTLLMSWEGWIPFDMAAAMVLGQNIGTTVTANLAALVANYQATRAARAHLIFNVLGVILALLVFYPSLNAVDWFMQHTQGVSPWVEASAVPVALSLYHTAFNVINTALLLGFVEKIAAIVCWLVPEVPEPEPEIDQPVYLTKASMAYPQTGIKALFDESLRLLQNAGYKAITHGLSVHRQDLNSGARLRDVVRNSEAVPVNIDELYHTRIKSVYGEILDFATRLQSEFALDEESVEAVRNILIADRQLVRTVKRMQPLHDNIVLFMSSGNAAIMSEYNRIRRRILKIMREIHRASESENPLRHIRKLEKYRKKASELDVLVSGRVNELLLGGEITQVMATSLINDSEQAGKIVNSLIDIATLLYYPKDRLVARLEEQRAPG